MTVCQPGVPTLPKPSTLEQAVLHFNDLFWNAKPQSWQAARLARYAEAAARDIAREQERRRADTQKRAADEPSQAR